MGEFIVLTKIAKLAHDNDISSNNQTTIFHFKDRKWVFLDAYKNDAEKIFDIIKIGGSLFNCTLADDHLVIIFEKQQRFHRKRYPFYDQLYDKLFALVFPEFKINSASTAENKLLKTYVTTQLFEALQSKHNVYFNDLTKNDINKKLFLPTRFRPLLCEYQKRSVFWLLKKERHCEVFPDYFEKLIAKDNESIVYRHLYTRFIQKEPPKALSLPPGGILADEMGLGKTVEMLALILLNPRRQANLSLSMKFLFSTAVAKRKYVERKVFCVCTSDSKNDIIQCKNCSYWQHYECVASHDEEIPDEEANSPYFCPSCWQNIIIEHGLIKTKATFIVSPNTIKMQWYSEIRCHIEPSLNVFIYDGVSKGKWISPRQLAQYDVVLTDYNVLRSEIHFTKDNISQRKTRNEPRYMRACSPILMLEWWRVLLDEAQMVESNTSNTTAMVRKIPALNRWAVSGTPIQKSLHDLHSLLEFIGFEAVTEKTIWNYLVNDFILHHEEHISNRTYPDLINVLQKCMWRTCKNQIVGELKIPPQQEIIHRIQFSNLEKLFYNEQHAECYSNFLTNVQKYTKKLNTISPQIMRIILQPFLKIRQSCTIPVVVSNNANNNFSHQQHKQFLQPKELHDYLKSSNETSCKGELRTMSSCHNGLAALYFLQNNYKEAIKHYEAVLKLASDYSHMNIAVDSLLQIHALHNIMQIKTLQPDIVVKSYEIYESQYNALEWKYLSTYANTLTNVKSSFTSAIGKIDAEITENFVDTMAECLQNIKADDVPLLIQKIQEECFPRFGQTNLKLANIVSTTSILFVITIWFDKLRNILNTILESIEELSYFTDNVRSRSQVRPAIWRDIIRLVNTVYDCHLSEIRDARKSKKDIQKEKKTSDKIQICKMCHLQNHINTFECLLFDKVIDKDTNFTEGLQNPSFEMYLCKLTMNFIKTKQVSQIEKNWLYLENLQLVCKRLIKLWIEMEYTIKAYDELNMCKMRISLTKDPDDKSVFKIMRDEINGRIVAQQTEFMNAQSQFAAKLARLRYIKHLEIDNNPGPCPICHLKEDDRYAVLECGHHVCFPCLKSIRNYVKGTHFKCSVCRNTQQNENIYYVTRSKINSSESEKIKGDYSSKITCIVSLILQLKKQHETEVISNRIGSPLEVEDNHIKILIFSQWKAIIIAIASALKKNEIKFRSQCTPTTIEEFKNPNLGITCLLMPFVEGSKGLNLIEATHVFLVEPILNPGEELQAIGRVHRFGQTRPTTVHRFIVSDSIEENIYNFILSSSSNSSGSSTDVQRRWEFDNLSLKDFENLFSLQQSSGECD